MKGAPFEGISFDQRGRKIYNRETWTKGNVDRIDTLSIVSRVKAPTILFARDYGSRLLGGYLGENRATIAAIAT